MLRFVALLLAAITAATPATAQLNRSDGETFIAAVREGDSAKAMGYLEQPGSRIANFKGFEGETALHIVTRKRSMPWLVTLVRNDADPNVVDKDGETPLLIATQQRWVEGSERLLRAGAKVDTPNSSGETPLMRAVLLRDERLIKLFLEKGADPDRADYSAGLSARDYARRDSRNPKILEMIETIDASPQAAQGTLEFGPTIEFPAGSGAATTRDSED